MTPDCGAVSVRDPGRYDDSICARYLILSHSPPSQVVIEGVADLRLAGAGVSVQVFDIAGNFLGHRESRIARGGAWRVEIETDIPVRLLRTRVFCVP